MIIRKEIQFIVKDLKRGNEIAINKKGIEGEDEDFIEISVKQAESDWKIEGHTLITSGSIEPPGTIILTIDEALVFSETLKEYIGLMTIGK